MKILVVGAGGREHAILWRLAQEPDSCALLCIPGNAGMRKLARTVAGDFGNVSAVQQAAIRESVDLVVVGPEVPLAAGLADLLAQVHIPCFGPTAGAAKIESSKAFAKTIMQKAGVPTAEFHIFEDFDRLRKYVEQAPFEQGWVVKADGLAAGKGAFVCESRQDVIAAAKRLLVDAVLGSAGRTVVLERKLTGREVSALYWCDGSNAIPLPPAQDYKRALDGDRGPNTGGMGAYCPAMHLTSELQHAVTARIILPVLHALANEGHPYRGILYAGLMLTTDGPQVIEFNCRFGDPETQVILPAWNGPFAATLLNCAIGTLPVTVPLGAARAAVCVTLAAEGYPDGYPKGLRLKTADATEHALCFHAGTVEADHGIVSNGGRVLNAIGLGNTIEAAREQAYTLAERLMVPGLRYRTDIAKDV